MKRWGKMITGAAMVIGITAGGLSSQHQLMRQRATAPAERHVFGETRCIKRPVTAGRKSALTTTFRTTRGIPTTEFAAPTQRRPLSTTTEGPAWQGSTSESITPVQASLWPDKWEMAICSTHRALSLSSASTTQSNRASSSNCSLGLVPGTYPGTSPSRRRKKST